MKKIIGLSLLTFTLTANADIITTDSNLMTEFSTWADAGYGVDGDTLIRISTGKSDCPTGVFIKASEHSKGVLSTTLAAYMSNKRVSFQIWSDRIWGGSGTPFCQVRAVHIKNS